MGSRKKTIRRVLKSVPLGFCVVVSTSIFPPNMWVELLCHLWSQFAPVWSSGRSLFHFNKYSSSKTLSGLMAHIVSHKTGTRIIVHLSTTVREWETSWLLWLTGGWFFMLMHKSEGSTPLMLKPFVWSTQLWTEPLPKVLWQELSSPLSTYSQESSNLVPVHLQDTK